jgi:hypothetical protein
MTVSSNKNILLLCHESQDRYKNYCDSGASTILTLEDVRTLLTLEDVRTLLTLEDVRTLLTLEDVRTLLTLEDVRYYISVSISSISRYFYLSKSS